MRKWGCGLILRNSRWLDECKWIFGLIIIILIGSGVSIVLLFGNIPPCDDPHTLQKLRGEFDHTLYATTLKLISESVMPYGPPQGIRLFQNRKCKALVETQEKSEVHLEYLLIHHYFQEPEMTIQIIAEP